MGRLGDVTGAEAYAASAMRAYVMMQARFRRRDGIYRRDGLLGRAGAAAHLWPFLRAFVATLDLAGVAPELLPGFDAGAELADRTATLERYWDPAAEPGGYASDVISSRFGGDRYYDDNAWAGLTLIEFERLRPGGGDLSRAHELLRFATGGWDDRPDVPHPGGVFWVEQGRGTGRRNHDRNTVSNAPNAQLGWHLAELAGGEPAGAAIGARDMYDWVNRELDAGAAAARYIRRAEAITRKTLRHYAGDRLAGQPRAFNAILFRNLLLLHDATGDDALRAEITAAMRGYADRPEFCTGATTLLDISGVVQILALLAWDPRDYGKLA